MLYRKRSLGKVIRVSKQWVTIEVSGAPVGYERILFQDLPNVGDAVEIATIINPTQEQPEKSLPVEERTERASLFILQLFDREKSRVRSFVMPTIQSVLDDTAAQFSAQYAIEFMTEDGLLVKKGEGFDEGFILTDKGVAEIVELKKKYPDMVVPLKK